MARQVLDNGIVLPSEYSDDWYDDMTSNLTKLDEVIGSDAEKLDESDVGDAALSNDYDDLDNLPAFNVLRRAAVTLTVGGTGNYSDLDSDSKIKAGDYVLDAANKLYSITAIDAANSTYTVSAAIINITDKSELGAAALSNSYDDLNNLPGYGILRFCSTAITDNSNVAFSSISSVSKIAAGDFLLDTAGKLYQIASVDTVNETAAVTTPVSQLALDANVMHLSGNETAAGIKTFSDDTYIKALNFTNEVPSQSSSSTSIMPIITTITYGDGSPSVQARLNIRVTADGIKSFYPHENNAYSLGLNSRSFSDFYSYHGYFRGQQQNDEYSGNARTNLTLLANRDTIGESGCLIDTFRANVSQGTALHIMGFGIKEKSLRYEGCRFSWEWNNNLNGYSFDFKPTKQGTYQAVKHNVGTSDDKWDTINGINPGVLSFPNLSNGLDISSYITTGSIDNSYTPPTDGWIWIRLIGSTNSGASIIQGDWGINARTITSNITNDRLIETNLAVSKDIPVIIRCVLVTDVVSAKFYPCLGNV